MANKQELFFPSSDGVHQVHGVLWLPETGEPKAVVQIVWYNFENRCFAPAVLFSRPER